MNGIKVEHLEVTETITLETKIVLRSTAQVTRFKTFVNNLALAIIEGRATLDDVRLNYGDITEELVSVSLKRFEECKELYSSRSTLGGVDEYLNNEFFTFSTTPNNPTR